MLPGVRHLGSHPNSATNPSSDSYQHMTRASLQVRLLDPNPCFMWLFKREYSAWECILLLRVLLVYLLLGPPFLTAQCEPKGRHLRALFILKHLIRSVRQAVAKLPYAQYFRLFKISWGLPKQNIQLQK